MKDITERDSKPLGELFERLVGIVGRLRAPDGCPWDRKQTPQSLKKYVLEEAYEVIEAIDEGRPQDVCEEIGDALFLLVFVAYLYQEAGKFRLADVLRLCAEKMIRRHPHVFGKAAVESAAEVIDQWQRIKEEEARRKAVERSAVLGNLPKTLPALQRAFRVGERASRVGFDWGSAEEIFPKLEEEIRELREALNTRDKERVTEEIGDLLFTVANLSRKLEINPEEALRQAVEKFTQRFIKMERRLKTAGKDLRAVSLEEMDRVWEEIKAEEKA